MKAREVFLLILIILAGVLFTHIQTGKLHWSFDEWGIITSEEFFYEETEDLAPPLPAILEILNSHGEVTVQGTETDRVTVTLKKTIWRRNQQEADEVDRELDLEISREPGRILISTNRSDFGRKNFETDFLVKIPKGMETRVRNSYGNVIVSGTGTSFVENRRGRISVSDITGPLTVENSYDDVRVENVTETCDIKNRYGEVEVRNVQGPVTVDLRTGEVRLEEVNRMVTVRGANNGVRGEKLAGPLDIESSFKKLSLFDVGPVKITGRQSPVLVAGCRGNIEIRNRFAKVDISGVEGDLVIEGKSLNVKGSRITSDNILIDSSNEDIELEEFSGKSNIRLAHGRVFLSPLPLTGDIDVRASYSDIRFQWPLSGEYPFLASVKNGEISWMLSEPPERMEENGTTTVKSFSGIQDAPVINLYTSYGTITIEEK